MISAFTGIDDADIVLERLESGIIPMFKAIDTCSGEFKAETPYMYSSYDSEDESFIHAKKRGTVIVLGSGPNRISQGLEFDYGAVKAVLELRRLGYRTVMVNSNPETVSTDFDISDTLYFEPMDLEHISNIVSREQPCRMIIQFSGQTGQNLASRLAKIFGSSLFLGTLPDSIEEIEDRTRFAATLQSSGVLQPEFDTVTNMQEAVERSETARLPLIVRSSFIIGGRAMDIVNDRKDLFDRLSALLAERPEHPILLSRYVENAVEIDVDFISDGRKGIIAGICTHVEEAGTHSGDATMIIGPDLPEDDLVRRIDELVQRFTTRYRLKGLSNLQLAVKDGQIYVIELNARASRSLPFVSKATGTDWSRMGVAAMLGKHPAISYDRPRSFFVKVPVFPFNRFLDLDAVLGPEMKSTGEGMAGGATLDEAFGKALHLMNMNLRRPGDVLLSVSDQDKSRSVAVAKSLKDLGYRLHCTPGTRRILEEERIDSEVVFKIEDLRSPRIDQFILESKPVLIINTPNARSGAIKDGNEIRKLAIRNNIPLITNIRLAESLLASFGSGIPVRPREISSYW